jgi:hypothetical protein
MNSHPESPNPIAENQPVDPAVRTADNPLSGREAYNIVSDTVVGMNTRKSDNVFQLKVILVCLVSGVLIGAIAGALLSDPDNRLVGTLAAGLSAGFAGVVVGLFGSGFYLMIYRGVRHLKGKHD